MPLLGYSFRETSKSHIHFSVASVLPIEEIAQWAHDVGAKVLLDACQSVPHMAVNVQSLDVDFLVASSHKVSVLPYMRVLSLIAEYNKFKK